MMRLHHLRLSTKFVLIALLFAAPVALLGYLFVQQSQKDILFAEREQAGTAYLHAIWPTFKAAIAGRDPTSREADTLAAASLRYDPAMHTTAPRRAFVAAPPGVARIDAGQTLIQKVADGSALTLDPDLDSYYLMDISTLKAPELAAAAHALIDVVARIPVAGEVSIERRADLAFAIGRLDRATRALRSSFESAYAGNPDGSVMRRLDPVRRGALRAAEELTRRARVLAGPIERGGTGDPRVIASLVSAYAATQGDLDRLWQATLGDLDRLLAVRIDGFENKLFWNLAIALALLVAVVGLMVAVSRSITLRLNTVAGAMNQMRGGSLESVVPHQDGGDEIGIIAQTLEVFRERLISLRAFEGDLIAQEANTAADLRFRDMLDVSPIGAVISTAEGRTLYSNNRFAEILGLDRDSVLASNNELAYLDPAQRSRYLEELSRAGRVRSMEVAFSRADGTAAVCLLAGENMAYKGAAGSLTWVYDITELKKAEEEVRSTQTRLIQSEKLASLGQLTAGIAHEIKNPLNFVNNFSELSKELMDELTELLRTAQVDDSVRDEVGEITGMISANLAKVVQHGQRADSIVRNMLLHSRDGGGERRAVDLNATVEESLNLAYHGARAERSDFNVTLERDYDPAIGEVTIFPQEFTRVLLNLLSNGFYAAHKRKIEAADGGFQPTLTVTTRALADGFELRIRDNGAGIPDAVRDNVFTPFFTTKPPGEGTGLGLSISHDIIVNQHGGTIGIDTQAGDHTEFIVTLPRSVAAPKLRMVS